MRVDASTLLVEAAGRHRVGVGDVVGRGGGDAVRRARREAMAEVRRRLAYSYRRIGQLFDERSAEAVRRILKKYAA